jgi:4-amino-4-deoxy-L-arabinose transferase-like glycosyltransferase
LRALDLLLLTFLLAGLLVWPVHAPPIGAHGEAREGLVVQDILRNDHWILPYRNGELPSKPPLFHWIAAAAAHPFGPSDATMRFPSALAAWVMVIATFTLALALAGRIAGWLAVGALLGTHGFWQSATEARVDMLFGACTTVALAAFFSWHRSRGTVARSVVYGAIACAVLAKGPAGIVLPGLVILAFLVREAVGGSHGAPCDRAGEGLGTAAPVGGGTRWHVAGVAAQLARDLRDFWSWPLAIGVFLLDAGWYGLAFRAGGRDFLAVQLVRENVDRFVGRGVFGKHGGRPTFVMVTELVTDLLPWNLVLVWAAVRLVRGDRENTGGRFLHAWWLVILVFFTVAFGKRDVYLLPLFPAIAVLAGRALAAWLEVIGDPPHLLALVPVPAGLRRAFPGRSALALVAIAIAAFDLVLLGTSQAVRVYRDRQGSLVRFARTVADRIPNGAGLYADADLNEGDLLVLAYRLDRPIPRVADNHGHGNRPVPLVPSEGTAGNFCLVPAKKSDDLTHAAFERIAESNRRGPKVALMLAPSDRGCEQRVPAPTPTATAP